MEIWYLSPTVKCAKFNCVLFMEIWNGPKIKTKKKTKNHFLKFFLWRSIFCFSMKNSLNTFFIDSSFSFFRQLVEKIFRLIFFLKKSQRTTATFYRSIINLQYWFALKFTEPGAVAGPESKLHVRICSIIVILLHYTALLILLFFFLTNLLFFAFASTLDN